MRFDLTTPCKDCPFRADITFYLGPNRVRSILHSLFAEDATFACHKTVLHDDDGNHLRGNPLEQHCAGALLLVERAGIANQMIQIAERFGLYDPTRLNRDAPVFATPEAMVAHYEELEG